MFKMETSPAKYSANRMRKVQFTTCVFETFYGFDPFCFLSGTPSPFPITFPPKTKKDFPPSLMFSWSFLPDSDFRDLRQQQHKKEKLDRIRTTINNEEEQNLAATCNNNEQERKTR